MLWIRSLYKSTLVYVSCVYVRECCVFGLASDGDEIVLGRYSSNDIAIKVLDEIVTHLNSLNNFLIRDFDKIHELNHNSFSVFNMPSNDSILDWF